MVQNNLLFRLHSKLRFPLLVAVPLLAVACFYAAKHTTIDIKAYAQVRAVPFVLEKQSYSFATNPQGDLFFRELTARRSDGSTSVVSRLAPFWEASSRNITFLNGSRVHIFDLVSAKTTWKVAPSDMAALKVRLANPPANCIFRPDAKLIAKENILGQDVVVTQIIERNDRSTRWLAPDLGCEPLQWRLESKQPDGSYKLVTEQRPVSLKLQEPDAAFFDTASNYQELMPSQVQRLHFEKVGQLEPEELQRRAQELDKRYTQSQ